MASREGKKKKKDSHSKDVHKNNIIDSFIQLINN